MRDRWVAECLPIDLSTYLQKAALIVMVLEEGEEGKGGLRLLEDVVSR